MTSLKFGDFTFPRNPEKLQRVYVREPIYQKDGDGNVYFAGMGPGKCVITGTGAFFGDTAYQDFSQLVSLFEAGARAALTDPTWGTCQAYLTKLELDQEPRENYVSYRFTFTRADSDGAIPK